MPKQNFYIQGYDKDADVFKTLAVTSDYENALIIGKALLHYHKNVKEIRRNDNREPFDWFEVSDECEKRIKVFTHNNPDREDQE